MDATPLERKRIPDAVGALARAFDDDAVSVSLWPDPARRARALTAFMTIPVADAYAHGNVTVIRDDRDVVAVAAWLPPGKFPLSPLRRARAMPRIGRVAMADRGAMRRFARFGTNIDAAFPDDRPAYLAVVGVVPERQGSGLGTAVLRPGLGLCDQTGSDAYLETANARAVPLYERLGFTVLSEGDALLPDGPTHWRMRRPAGS